MSTRKNVASPLVRFSVGANEVAVADAWRAAGDAEIGAARKFYDVLFAPVSAGGHAGDMAALLPFKDGAKRSNEQQAFYDFAQMLYLVLKCGADLAAVLKDANVKGDTMVQRPGVKADGSAYKPQAKRALRDTLLGAKDWGAFVRRLVSIKDAEEYSAAVEAGEVKEGEAVKGAKASSKSDREYVLGKIGEVVKRLSKDVEKLDGSIAPDVARKAALALADVLSMNGIK